MTPKAADVIRHSFWRDLTGQSERWLRTIVLSVLVGRLSLLAIGSVVVAVAGIEVVEQYSGRIESLKPGVILSALLVAPIIESLAIRLAVWVFGSRFGWKWPVWATALACAALAVPLHGLGPMSLVAAPFFGLMAAIQHHWMVRGRGWAGFWLITAAHAAGNTVGVLTTALMGADIR